MKRLKRMTAIFLCLLLTTTIFGSSLVFAKAKPIPLNIAYKGKTITVIRDANGSRGNTASLKATQKRWGKSSVKKVSIWKSYTFKAGKSSITLSNNNEKRDRIGAVELSVKDKNISVAGVKVGTSKTKTVSLLRKAFGKKAVHVKKAEISCDFGPYLPISFKLRNGKVSSITWFRS